MPPKQFNFAIHWETDGGHPTMFWVAEKIAEMLVSIATELLKITPGVQESEVTQDDELLPQWKRRDA